MLGRLTQWVSAKLDVKEDDHLKQRFDALTRLKKATLDVMQAADGRSTSSGELDVMSPSPASGASTPKKPRRVLTDDDLCVHEFGNALETCLKLGLRHQSDHTVSLWNVLYTSSLVLDEPSLVNAIQQAATLSQTDAGKALCWMKLALNKQTMETSLMIIFSMACDQVVRTSYEDWALVRCSEGLDLFLQMVIDCRALRFNLKVDDEPFRALPPREVPTIPIAPQASEATKVDGDATAVPTAVGDSSPLPASLPTSPLASDVSVSADKLTPQAETPAAVPDDEFVEISAVVFPHRHKGIKPWQHVFGVSIAYLSKNPYHSRFALIDPVLSIPNIVQDCIDILYEFPDTPRLFRTTVLSVTVSQLREVVESEGALPGDLDAHGAGALLLDFFKNLPESLLTSEKYEAFVASGRLKDEEASVRNIALLVQELPVHCKYVLEKVIGVLHFLQLPEHAQHNGIDLTLASFMLAPVVAFKSEALTTAAGGRRKMSHPQNHDVRFAAVGAQVVERMIKHHDVIFQDVRVQVSDALERLESKKQALLSMYQLYKMKPQVNFLSDRQYLDEISDIFVESVKKKESPHCDSPPSNNNHTLDRIPSPVVRKTMASPLKHRASSPSLYEGVLPLSTSAPPSYSAVMAGATSNARTSSGSSLGSRRQPAAIPELNNIPDDGDRRIVDAWQKHGFNRPTILGNFDKGGVLLLRCVAHMVKNDRNLLERLYTQALPTVQSSFDAGLVASAICKSLVRLLHLV